MRNIIAAIAILLALAAAPVHVAGAQDAQQQGAVFQNTGVPGSSLGTANSNSTANDPDPEVTCTEQSNGDWVCDFNQKYVLCHETQTGKTVCHDANSRGRPRSLSANLD